jgi:hypothetical protein
LLCEGRPHAYKKAFVREIYTPVETDNYRTNWKTLGKGKERGKHTFDGLSLSGNWGGFGCMSDLHGCKNVGSLWLVVAVGSRAYIYA